MVTTMDKGCYLLDGSVLIPDDQNAKAALSEKGAGEVTKEEAKKRKLREDGKAVSRSFGLASIDFCAGCSDGMLRLYLRYYRSW